MEAGGAYEGNPTASVELFPLGARLEFSSFCASIAVRNRLGTNARNSSLGPLLMRVS